MLNVSDDGKKSDFLFKEFMVKLHSISDKHLSGGKESLPI